MDDGSGVVEEDVDHEGESVHELFVHAEREEELFESKNETVDESVLVDDAAVVCILARCVRPPIRVLGRYERLESGAPVWIRLFLFSKSSTDWAPWNHLLLRIF